MKTLSISAAVVQLFLGLLLTSFVSAFTPNGLQRRQTADPCSPACAELYTLQQACGAENDTDCCRPTYPSALLTCAQCLTSQPGKTDAERDYELGRAHAYIEKMTATCQAKGQALKPASAGAASSTQTDQSSAGTSSSKANSGSGARTVYQGGQVSWLVLLSLACAFAVSNLSA